MWCKFWAGNQYAFRGGRRKCKNCGLACVKYNGEDRRATAGGRPYETAKKKANIYYPFKVEERTSKECGFA